MIAVLGLIALTAVSAAAPGAIERSPLHRAVIANDAPRIDQLLAAGADPDARDDTGRTPLHLAARRLRAELVDRLLAAGADVNARDDHGATPLLTAADAGPAAPEVDALLTEVARRLLAAGADPNAADGSGATPLFYASQRGHTRLAALLRTHGAVAQPPAAPRADDRAAYRMYPEIGPLLLAAETNFPDICRRYDLGLSTNGRHLWALLITDHPDLEEDEPEFRYVSTLHGNEWLGAEMCLYLIDHLTTSYGTDPRVTALVDSVELWLVPLANPDGHEQSPPTRTNAQGVDINRNFPCPYTSPNNSPTGRAPETAALMNWCFAQSFTLAANFHTGAMVVNYPFDANASGASVDTPTPDDDMFEWISREYSRHNLPMWNSPYFDDGITNGADWYVIYGGLQDWSYVYMGTNEVTIELSDTFIPSASQLPTYWSNNRESMLAYAETSLIGVRGLVIDDQTGRPLPATVTVLGRDHAVFTDPDVGDYHRMLLPGTYALRFDAGGCDPVLAPNVLVNAGPATRLDVAMPAPAHILSPNGGEIVPLGAPLTIAWSGSPAARFCVQYTDRAGEITTDLDGFESGTFSGDYATGGHAAWYVATGTAHNGTRAARSGKLNDNQTSWLERTVECTGNLELRFWYRVSSESGYDYLRFTINGAQRFARSGDTGWLEYVETLPPGTHTLRWEYAKDGSLAGGSDCAWLDDLELTGEFTDWIEIVALTEPGATSVDWTPAAPATACAVRVRAVYDTGLFGAWDESDAPFAVVDASAADFDADGDVDLTDFASFAACFNGPDAPPAPGCAADADFDADADVDLNDFAAFSAAFTGPR